MTKRLCDKLRAKLEISPVYKCVVRGILLQKWNLLGGLRVKYGTNQEVLQ